MPAKLRTKTHHAFLHVVGDGDILGHINASKLVDLPYSEERIIYTNSGFGVGYNMCDHTLSEWAINSAERSQSTAEIPNLQFDYPGFYIRNSRPAGKPFAADLTDLCRGFVDDKDLNHKAFRSMVRRIRPPRYLSIANFLYELKDLKRMIDIWSRRRRFLNNISSGFLNEEFGWRPFLSDVCGLLTGLKTFHRAFKTWCEQQHKPHITHYRKILTEDDLVPRFINSPEPVWPASSYEFTDIPQGESFVTPPGPTMRANISYQIYHLRAPEWICTMKYTYWCKEALGILRTVWAFLDAFNVYWDPQVLWNAVPFSFIVDWFFNVGDWLHQTFSKPNLTVILRVIDYCISVKADCLTDGSILIPLDGESSDPGTNYGYTSYMDRHRLYLRKPTSPVTEDPLHKLEPMQELKHFLLALALGHNCIRPIRKHGKRQTGFRGAPG